MEKFEELYNETIQINPINIDLIVNQFFNALIEATDNSIPKSSKTLTIKMHHGGMQSISKQLNKRKKPSIFSNENVQKITK